MISKLSIQPDPARYLRTDHLRLNLTNRSIKGGLTILIAQATQLVTALGSFMILARLLTPSDFGLLAMVSVLLNLVKKFKDFGLATAITHQAEINHIQLSQIFWLNFKRNGLLALLLVALAPVAAWFYGEPNLIPIILVVTVGVFATGVSRLHRGLLQRQMRFTVLSAMEVISLAVGALVAIVMAIKGAGYWALVFQQLVMFLTQTTFLWAGCGWRPASQLAIRAQPAPDVESLLVYSKYTTIASLLNHFAKEIDRILLGRVAGAAQLGLYQSAQRWSTWPIQSIFTPLNSVTLAGSSRLQGNPERYRAYAKSAFLVVFTSSVPVLTFMYISADDVILLLLGTRWLEVIPIFRVLALAALGDLFNRMTVWIYQSEGQTKRRYKWTLFSVPLTLAAIAAGAPWSANGIATGYATATLLLALPSVSFCLKTSVLRGRDFWGAVWRPILSAITATILLAVIRFLTPVPENLFWRLSLHATTFATLYASFWFLFPGGMQQLRVIIEESKSIYRGRRQPVSE